MSCRKDYLATNTATLRGLVALLADAPATTSEAAMLQHISPDSSLRLMKILEKARIVRRGNKKHKKFWALTQAYIRGDIPFEPEKLAGGR